MRLLPFIITTLTWGQAFTLTTQTTPPSPAPAIFMMATFWNPPGSGSVGGTLAIYQSTDGVTWGTMGSTSYNCISHVRDPTIIEYAGNVLLSHTGTAGTPTCNPDVTHINFSSAPNSLTGLTFGNTTLYACPLAGFCWAPNWFADPRSCTFTAGMGWSCASLTNLHLYFANSTQVVCCSAFTLYEMHPTAADFITNTASWSTPVALTFASGTPVPIDPVMICKNSSTGADCQNPTVANDQLYMFYNDKASSTGCLNYGTIPGTTGAITPVVTGDCLGFTNYVEGPMVYHVVAGSPGTWRWCGDPYQNTYDIGQISCKDSTNNWSTWGSTFTTLSPTQAKQGEVIPYP